MQNGISDETKVLTDTIHGAFADASEVLDISRQAVKQNYQRGQLKTVEEVLKHQQRIHARNAAIIEQVMAYVDKKKRASNQVDESLDVRNGK